MVLIAPPRWEELPLRTVAELDGIADHGAAVLVMGEVGPPRGEALELPVDLPLPLPPGTPSLTRLAAAVISVEEMPLLSRPIRALHELVRDFPLRGEGGTSALVRWGDGRRDVLELHLGQPLLHAAAGERDVFLRSVSIGDRVVVGGHLRFEIDPAGRGQTYREAPRLAIVDAETLFDATAWDDLRAWQALPWHRKLSLIIRNR